jgi:hypothetical protein
MSARLHRWHRATGVVAALLVFVLAITGIALTYTETLRLDERLISSETLLDWYAIRPPPRPVGVFVDPHWVSLVGSRLYFDTLELAPQIKRLSGAVSTIDFVIVGVDQELWLLTPRGELIERLTAADGVPPELDAVGLTTKNIAIARAGPRLYEIDATNGSVKAVADQPVTWAGYGELPEALTAELAAHYRGRELTLERVVLDLHTGRFFGTIGASAMSLSALAMMFLAVSGAATWWRRVRRLHRHGK